MTISAWINIILILSLSSCVLAPEVLLFNADDSTKLESLSESTDDEAQIFNLNQQLDTNVNLPTTQEVITQENPPLINERTVHTENDPEEAHDHDHNPVLIQKESFENGMRGSQFSEQLLEPKSLNQISDEAGGLVDVIVTERNHHSGNQLVDKVSEEGMQNLQNAVTDEKPVELEVGDIQSFEEWKKNQIQEETASVEIHVPPQRLSRAKKVNYASQDDCGAKVLTHNPAAKNVGAILDENKDLYLLNPCSSQIWFVVELCEPIQVDQVQLANLELFSSMPCVFDVSISERFPAREWRLLDTFEARNERVVQSFSPKRELVMFAKYMKFEMRSHFGNEHFCPLTLIRVFGVSMEEEYDDDVEEKSVKEKLSKVNDEIASDDEKAKEINNIHIPTDERQKANDDEGGSIGKMLDIVKTAVGSLLGSKPVAANDAVSSRNTPIPDQNRIQEENFDPDWESPVTLVTNRSEMEVTTAPNTQPPLVTLIETGGGEDIVPPPPQFSTPLYSLKFLSSFSSDNFNTRLCFFLEFLYRVSLLSCVVQPHGNYTSGYGAFPLVIDKKKSKPTRIRPETSSASEVVGNDEAWTRDFTDSEAWTRDFTDSEAWTRDFTDSEAWTRDFSNSEERQTQPAEDKVNTEAPRLQSGLTPRDEVVPNSTIENTTVKKQDLNDTEDGAIAQSSTVSSEIMKSTSEASNVDNFHETHDAVTSDNSGSKHGLFSMDNSNEEVVVGDEANTKVQFSDFDSTITDDKQDEESNDVNRFFPVISEDASSRYLSNSPSSPNETNIQSNGTTPRHQDQASKAAEVPGTSGEPTSSSPSHEEGTSRMEPIMQAEEYVAANFGTGTSQKESVVMRMNNRIRTLEKNVSLTSEYLENLSQRFKRQSDEMQRVFQQTEKRLEETSQAVEENKKNLFRITTMEKTTTETLNKKMGSLADSFDYLNRCMIARHLCLMALEGICFVVICVTCFGFRQIRVIRRLRQAETKIDELLLQKPNIRDAAVTLFAEKKKLQNKSSNLTKSERRNSLTKPPGINFTDFNATNDSSIKPRLLPNSKSSCSLGQRTKSQKVSFSLIENGKGMEDHQSNTERCLDKTCSDNTCSLCNIKSMKTKKNHFKTSTRSVHSKHKCDKSSPSDLSSNNKPILSASECNNATLSWQNRFSATSGKTR